MAEIENHEEKDRRDPKNEKLDPPPLSVLPRAQRPFEIGKDRGKGNHKENRNPVSDSFDGEFVAKETGVEINTEHNKRGESYSPYPGPPFSKVVGGIRPRENETEHKPWHGEKYLPCKCHISPDFGSEAMVIHEMGERDKGQRRHTCGKTDVFRFPWILIEDMSG
jgi:hypothetical protein